MAKHTASTRSDDGNAFLPDPDGGPIQVDGSVDEEMVADFMMSATSGEDAGEDIRDQDLTEEYGGPFVTTTMGAEVADDVDESNPTDAYREAVPSPMRGT